jgi:hypothetical protein
LQLGGTIPRRFTNVRSDRRNRHEFTMVAGRGGRLKRLYLRTWDPATERYTTTRAGRAQGYHDQVRFIVHVPVTGHVEDRTFDTTRDGRALTLPVDSAEVFQMHPELHTLAVVRAHESQARMTEFIREAIITFLRGLARDPAAFDAGREKVALTDYNQSDVWYSFNSAKAREIGNWTFDMELERFQDADHPTNETVLGRPLRAFIDASDDMWMKHHIVAEAFATERVELRRAAAPRGPPAPQASGQLARRHAAGDPGAADPPQGPLGAHRPHRGIHVPRQGHRAPGLRGARGEGAEAPHEVPQADGG